MKTWYYTADRRFGWLPPPPPSRASEFQSAYQPHRAQRLAHGVIAAVHELAKAGSLGEDHAEAAGLHKVLVLAGLIDAPQRGAERPLDLVGQARSARNASPDASDVVDAECLPQRRHIRKHGVARRSHDCKAAHTARV